MSKLITKKIFFFCILSLCIISCKKVKDTSPPTIRFISPIENDTLVGSNKEYTIQFEAKDNLGLFSETLTIYDENNVTLSEETRSIYGTVYTYSNTFEFSGTPNKIKKIVLKVTIEDEAKNLTSQKIDCYLKL
jgi:hypothetical protein